jgi:hypothetical protein
LERDVGLCIPTDGVAPQNTAENQRVISKDTSDCSCMDIQVLVPDVSGTIGGPTVATSTMGKAYKVAKISSVQQQHTDVEPTRLASVRRILVQRGFSQTVATRIIGQ